MPTFITHALVGAALGAPFARPGTPRNLWITGAVLAAAPDLDVIGFQFGIHYDDLLGHRGLSHSLCFAAVTAAIVTAIWFRGGAGPLRPRTCWWYLFLAMASHGLLDMLTDGGRGIALFAPLVDTRLFFPLRPVAVAPIGVRGIFAMRMSRVLATEALWIWLPTAVMVLLSLRFRPRLLTRCD